MSIIHNTYLDDIDSTHFQFNIGTILVLIEKLRIHIHPSLVIDLDNILHDYLLHLRYQLSHNDARSIIIDRIKKDTVDISDYHLDYLIGVLLDSIYYQMCIYNLYTRGELDYRSIKNSTIQIASWQDQYTPIFEYIDRPNMVHLIELERLSYIYR